MILVTNDDGLGAEGLWALRKVLGSLSEVMVIAPDREQSATSHSLTLNHPLRVKEIEDSVMSVDGTPTDCVLLAFNGVLKEKPQLVVAGINHGPNLGEDVSYSGTVAAAMEGMLQGVPSFAISMAGKPPYSFEVASSFALKLATMILEKGMDSQTLLNVNVPNLPGASISHVKVTKLGNRLYRDVLIKKVDPRGRTYYWIGGDEPSWRPAKGHTDFKAIEEGMISITPLRLDMTDYARMSEMESWNLTP
jgi:5'-nucleotidase